MDPTVAAMLLLVLGICLGALPIGASYTLELRRMARFLRERDPRSNGRLTTGAPTPGLTDLADAVNAQLDRADSVRIDDLRHRQEFQRDLSALSHDIRTPLTGAKGYLQLAAADEDPAVRARHLAAATERIDGTAALLDQLFSYTKASDPDLALDMGPIAIRPLLEQVLLGHYPEFEQRGWEPSVDFEDDACTTEADREALTRIFENLVANALRYGSDALRVEQQVARDERRAHLVFSNRVEDPAHIDEQRLFERFYQADSTRGGCGAGLGLSTAAKLAEVMGMEISAHMEGDVLSIELELSPVSAL